MEDVILKAEKQKRRKIDEPVQTTTETELQPKSKLRENIEAILIAIILALFIRTFIVQAFKIPSGSMIPTLLIGDHILVNKFIYGVKLPFIDLTVIPGTTPKRGDIVVFKYPQDTTKDYIKRVIALGGDKLEIKNRKVYINDQPVDDAHAFFDGMPLSHTKSIPRDNFGPIIVPEGNLFVMGDNRDHSFDSRFWGFVSLDALKGKAFIVYFSWDTTQFSWSLDNILNVDVRWKRFGHILR